MILSAFLARPKQELPDATWHLVTGASPTVVFPAISPDFGDIEVIEHEHDKELTVNFGRFTHAHFASYDEDLTEEGKAAAIAADTVACLADVFSDRLEFYGRHSTSGGFRRKGTQGKLSKFIVGSESHVWSGNNG